LEWAQAAISKLNLYILRDLGRFPSQRFDFANVQGFSPAFAGMVLRIFLGPFTGCGQAGERWGQKGWIYVNSDCPEYLEHAQPSSAPQALEHELMSKLCARI
jgi:hypothetical protein